MKAGSNNRENIVQEVPPVDPVGGRTDKVALLALRRVLGRLRPEDSSLLSCLICTPPRYRLLRALTAVLRNMMRHDVVNAGGDGLDDDERAALMALHSRTDINTDILGTAYALLCVPERAILLAQWREEVRDATARKHHMLTQGDIDEFKRDG